ncbi:MAG: hypothetical protein ACLTDX_19700 [[Clostridium] innocuum]
MLGYKGSGTASISVEPVGKADEQSWPWDADGAKRAEQAYQISFKTGISENDTEAVGRSEREEVRDEMTEKKRKQRIGIIPHPRSYLQEQALAGHSCRMTAFTSMRLRRMAVWMA